LPVGEEQRRYSVAVRFDDPAVLGQYLLARGRIGDGLIDQIGIQAQFGEQVAGDRLFVGLVTVLVQGPAGAFIPGVEVGHRPAAQQSADPHHRPPVGPLPFPRVFLALGAVDLLKAEEAPIHLQTGLVPHLADPLRGLVGVRTHDVEVEIDELGVQRHVYQL